MKKVTSQAYSNVALLKYWGRKDTLLRLPANNSISINISGLVTRTSLNEHDHDEFYIDDHLQQGQAKEKIQRFIDLSAGLQRRPVKIISHNSFPASTGFSSSASGFAALAVAVNQFYELGLDERDLSILARKGSGSASRSVPGGFVRWNAGTKDADSFAETIYPADYWDLRILAVVVSQSAKGVPTSDGHEAAQTSPYFEARMSRVKQTESGILKALANKDFEKLGLLVEQEMLEFHSIPMTSTPSLLYWYPETVRVIHEIRSWRSQGIMGYVTINTGHNLFVITLPEYEEVLLNRLRRLDVVESVISNRVGEEAKIIDTGKVFAFEKQSNPE